MPDLNQPGYAIYHLESAEERALQQWNGPRQCCQQWLAVFSGIGAGTSCCEHAETYVLEIRRRVKQIRETIQSYLRQQRSCLYFFVMGSRGVIGE